MFTTCVIVFAVLVPSRAQVRPTQPSGALPYKNSETQKRVGGRGPWWWTLLPALCQQARKGPRTGKQRVHISVALALWLGGVRRRKSQKDVERGHRVVEIPAAACSLCCALSSAELPSAIAGVRRECSGMQCWPVCQKLHLCGFVGPVVPSDLRVTAAGLDPNRHNRRCAYGFRCAKQIRVKRHHWKSCGRNNRPARQHQGRR